MRRRLAAGAVLAVQQGEESWTLARRGPEDVAVALWEEWLVAGAEAILEGLPSLGQAGRRWIGAVTGPMILQTYDHALEASVPLRIRVVDHPALCRLTERAAVPLVQVQGLVPEVRLELERDPRPILSVRVAGPTWQILDPGPYSVAELQRRLTRTVVFVCTGNTCRSPLAEVLMKKHLAARLDCTEEALPARGWRIVSAGLQADEGQPASPYAREVAQGRGVSLAGHRSQGFLDAPVEEADYLIALTRGHREVIRAWTNAPGVRLLRGDGQDVSDPYGGPREVYEACAEEIEQHVRLLADQLLQAEGYTRLAGIRG
jgi:protein-tyrosine-phosphatase